MKRTVFRGQTNSLDHTIEKKMKMNVDNDASINDENNESITLVQLDHSREADSIDTSNL